MTGSSLDLDAAAIASLFQSLTTAHVADACLRKGIEVRCAPHDLRPLDSSSHRVAGRVRPARHYGSVDVFLEALEKSCAGEILVVDNDGRRDEACVGDLIALETKNAGLGGIVIWGLHRDTAEIRELGLPLFSQGAIPTGPLRIAPREPEALISARVGAWTVDAQDIVLGDEDGVLFLPASRAQEIAAAARLIRDTERTQAAKMRAGTSLRDQLQFAQFVTRRAIDPNLTLRQHLREVGGAVEE
jgi:regulator of RNase E activity RraA